MIKNSNWNERGSYYDYKSKHDNYVHVATGNPTTPVYATIWMSTIPTFRDQIITVEVDLVYYGWAFLPYSQKDI